MKKRQKIRRFLLLISILLFPVTMIYFSPAMVFRGARLGVLSGSYMTFALLFCSALVFGRAWCGWLCPAGGFSDMVHVASNKPYTHNGLKRLKFVLWGLWLVSIAMVLLFVGKGFSTIDVFLGTQQGISIHNIQLLAVYYVVIAVIVSSALVFGRRGFCHSLCWMAPFMIIGRKISNRFALKALRLSSKNLKCSGCGQCEAHCPMGLPVKEMRMPQNLEHTDCILCGVCCDVCPDEQLFLSIEKPIKIQSLGKG